MISIGQALDANPLIAILRGLEPANAVEVAGVLFDAGFRIIEVPMNSPDPLKSISRIVARYGDHAIVGAGTVLTKDDVNAVHDVGGRIIVSPNLNPVVGKSALAHDLAWCPGVLTPSEAFAALDLSASILKFFPAEMVPPSAIGAIRAVLPKGTIVAAVGGISPEKMASYKAAGTDAFGLGSALFKPDYSLDDVAARARGFMDALAAMREKS